MQDVPRRRQRGTTAPRDKPLWIAVRGLPTKQRHAVAYHYVADLAYAEVASIMGTGRARRNRRRHEALRERIRIDRFRTSIYADQGDDMNDLDLL
jgi:DNA-directed RNA polymerase specialized sigma24 family protein